MGIEKTTPKIADIDDTVLHVALLICSGVMAFSLVWHWFWMVGSRSVRLTQAFCGLGGVTSTLLFTGAYDGMVAVIMSNSVARRLIQYYFGLANER